MHVTLFINLQITVGTKNIKCLTSTFCLTFFALTSSIFYKGWKVRWVSESKFRGLSNGKRNMTSRTARRLGTASLTLCSPHPAPQGDLIYLLYIEKQPKVYPGQFFILVKSCTYKKLLTIKMIILTHSYYNEHNQLAACFWYKYLKWTWNLVTIFL